MFKLSKKEKKTKIEEENQNKGGKPKVIYAMALVMTFLAAENENLQLED